MTRILQPRSVRTPWAVAPKWMVTLYVPCSLWTLVACAYTWAAQLVCWALLLGAWAITRTLCALWNWVLLPILAAAVYRFRARRAARRGDTVAGAVVAALPAPARAAHVIQASHVVHALPVGSRPPVAYPAAPAVVALPAPAPQQVVPVIQEDGSILYEPWAIETA